MIKQYYQSKQFNYYKYELMLYYNKFLNPMETLQKKYSNLLDKIYEQAKDKEKENAQQTLANFFQGDFLREINRINGLKVIFDNQIAKSIINKAKYESQKIEVFNQCEKKIHFLNRFSNTLVTKKFISSREFSKIQKTIKEIKEKPSYKWNMNLPFLSMADDKEEFREQFCHKYAGNDSVDIEDIDEVKNVYQTFWKNAFEMTINRNLLVKIDECISKFQDKTEVYSPEILEMIESFLGNLVGKDDKQIQINNNLRTIAENQFIGSNQEHLQNLQKQYEYVLSILNRFSGMKIWKQEGVKVNMRVAKFGSNVSGFASKNTDLDLTLLTDCYINEKKVLEFLKDFLDAEFKDKDKRSYKLQFIHSARIPLIKLLLRQNKMETHFDIIVNNILGVVNSKFMSVYGSIKWIKQLGILIKLWGKHKCLINQQMFSSYSMNLLLLHFLLETNRIGLIMDGRHRDEKTPHFMYRRLIKDVKMQEFKVHYKFKSRSEDVTKLTRVNICEVLTEFFQYYSRNGKHWKKEEADQIITVDGSQAKYFDPEYIFTIKDPFDEEHNPGRVKHPEKNRVVGAFTEAYQCMNSKKFDIIEDLFY